MDKIYKDAKDVSVAGVLIYADIWNKQKAYFDKECTRPMKDSDLKEAYLKGAFIVDVSQPNLETFYRPTSLYADPRVVVRLEGFDTETWNSVNIMAEPDEEETT